MSPQPSENDRVRKTFAASVQKILSSHGMELAQCGLKSDLRPFDERTGYWEDPGVSNKPPRWIVHIAKEAGSIHAWVPEQPGSDRLAFANTANRQVGGLFVRVIPALHHSTGVYKLHEQWEWILFFCFAKPLAHGSSGQLFEKFDPRTGTLAYLGEEVTYASAGLACLSSPESATDIGDGETMTYAEATDALSKLLHVMPAAVLAPAATG